MIRSETLFVILAGGQSQRMGQDKAETLLHGKRMIDFVIERVSRQCSNIVLSGPKNYQTEFQKIPDLQKGPKGPVAGIYAAYRHCMESEIGDGFFTSPMDAPDLPNDLCERLWNFDQSQYASGPERSHPAFAWWRIADLHLVFETMDFTQSQSLHQLTRSAKAKAVVWHSENPFFNINSPNDVQEYLTRQ